MNNREIAIAKIEGIIETIIKDGYEDENGNDITKSWKMFYNEWKRLRKIQSPAREGKGEIVRWW